MYSFVECSPLIISSVCICHTPLNFLGIYCLLMAPIVIAAIVVLSLVIAYVVWRLYRRGSCETAVDCPVDQTCVGGQCVPAQNSCGGGPPCAPPAICVGGKCVTPPTCGSGPPCAPPAVCVGNKCVTPPAGCGAGPPCVPPAVCVGGKCVTPPAGCGAGPPCAPPAVCVGSKCVTGCGGGPPCTPPAVCVNGICARPPPPPTPCAGGAPCVSPATCIGGVGCGRLQGRCYGWVPLPLATPAIPANAVGVVQTSSTSMSVPAIGVDASGAWSAGAAILPWPLPASWSAKAWLQSYIGWYLDDSSGGYIQSPPAQLYYLAAAAGCPLTPATTTDMTEAIVGLGLTARPVCWGEPSVQTTYEGMLMPKSPGQACTYGTALIATN